MHDHIVCIIMMTHSFRIPPYFILFKTVSAKMLQNERITSQDSAFYRVHSYEKSFLLTYLLTTYFHRLSTDKMIIDIDVSETIS